MAAPLELESESGAASIVQAYDAATDTFAFASDGRIWQALAHARRLGATGRDRKVAIVDTMCDLGIARLAARVRRVPTAAPQPHGTAVALLISHIAPECVFDVYDILGADGRPDEALVWQSLLEAAQSDVDIVNVSLGRAREFRLPTSGNIQADYAAVLNDPHKWLNDALPDEPNCRICAAANEATSGGKLVFAAAGNSLGTICCPARAADVVGVGFQRPERETQTSSDGGSWNVASGAGVPRYAPMFDLAIDEIAGVLGTSFACPIYAGVGALGLSRQEMFAYSSSTRMGTFAQSLHNDISRGIKDSSFVEVVQIAYERALALQPHVHSRLGARLRPDLPYVDPSTCWSCGFFSEDKYVNAGLFFAVTGRPVDAFDLLSAARRLMPWSADAASNLGYVFRELGCLDQALELYEQAMVLRPGDATFENAAKGIRQRLAKGEKSRDPADLTEALGKLH